MTREQIYLQIVDTMTEVFELDPQQVTWDAKLREDLALDSIDAVDMAVRLQQMTGKKMPLSELTHIRTIADVVDAVVRHVAPSTDSAENHEPK